jgi:hypothetical protein
LRPLPPLRKSPFWTVPPSLQLLSFFPILSSFLPLTSSVPVSIWFLLDFLTFSLFCFLLFPYLGSSDIVAILALLVFWALLRSAPSAFCLFSHLWVLSSILSLIFSIIFPLFSTHSILVLSRVTLPLTSSRCREWAVLPL